MNSHLLVGYTFDKTHKVVLDGVSYSSVKKAFHEIKESDEFSKLEIWSRTNGLERSKKLNRKSASKIAETPKVEEPQDLETEEENVEETGDDFQIEETPVKPQPQQQKKKRGRS